MSRFYTKNEGFNWRMNNPEEWPETSKDAIGLLDHAKHYLLAREGWEGEAITILNDAHLRVNETL